MRQLDLLRLSAALLTLVVACAGPPPAAPRDTVEPIPLGPGGSRTLAFVHSIERIPAGSLLGIARWERSDEAFDEIRAKGGSVRSKSYNVAITDLLREHGYDVQDEADAIFDAGRAVRVRYQLAGILHDLDVDYVYTRPRRFRTPVGTGTAKVAFEIQVHDLVKNKTVFQRTYHGTGHDEGTEPQPVVPAVVDAVRHALADPDFVAMVVDHEVVASADVGAMASIARCKTKPTALPGGMEGALESVVVVRAGGASGGGVILSEDGYVVTAAHVIGEGEEVFVSLRSGPMIPARVVTRNSGRDVALLQLPGHGYRCAPTLRADAIPTGSAVFSINILLDEQNPAVSRGVVSGYQELEGRRYIQTDASINPGSSGGPLFDGKGHVVAIVTEKVVGFGIEGHGLGVPINEVEPALRISWE